MNMPVRQPLLVLGLFRREKWGLPPIRPRYGPRKKALSLKRIGWLYPIFATFISTTGC